MDKPSMPLAGPLAFVIATEILYKDLKPGDLFSTAGPTYWASCMSDLSIGQKVYMRTNEPCPADQANELIFLITIDTKEHAA